MFFTGGEIQSEYPKRLNRKYNTVSPSIIHKRLIFECNNFIIFYFVIVVRIIFFF